MNNSHDDVIIENASRLSKDVYHGYILLSYMHLFVDHITTVDCSFLDQTFGLMGMSWIVDVILERDLDHQGMVMDFGEVKKKIKHIIDSSLDHTLLVPVQCPNTNIEKHESSYYVECRFNKGRIEYSAPVESISLLEGNTTNAELLEAYLQQTITEALPDEQLSIYVHLRKEDIKGASYGYSHGLKKHGGDCQRMAHGHRSQIKIIESVERQNDLEQIFSQRWNGIYVGQKEDLVQTFEEGGISYNVFAYEASQGSFRLTIPDSCCTLIDDETTVENIAEHICSTLCAETKKKLIVHAYEGVNKGAIAYHQEAKQQILDFYRH
ncbi:MAG: 6-carboxytetrahydropterin synthase [Microcystaceae cyanobacterium]